MMLETSTVDVGRAWFQALKGEGFYRWSACGGN